MAHGCGCTEAAWTVNCVKSYAHHEYARLFPMLDEQALQELADDIEKNGLQQASELQPVSEGAAR